MLMVMVTQSETIRKLLYCTVLRKSKAEYEYLMKQT